MYDKEREFGFAALFVLAVFIFVIAYCRVNVGDPVPDTPTKAVPRTGTACAGDQP
jgi:hypothetical protein